MGVDYHVVDNVIMSTHPQYSQYQLMTSCDYNINVCYLAKLKLGFYCLPSVGCGLCVTKGNH